MFDLRKTLIIFLFFLGCDRGAAKDTRIVGGTIVTDRSQFPYQVSIRWIGQHICGGAIIDARHIVTAAHCVEISEIASNYRIYAGDLNLVTQSITTDIKYVSEIFVHPLYTRTTSDNDLAILRLNEAYAKWSDEIRPIDYSEEEIDGGEICTTSGWGLVKYLSEELSADLRYVDVPIVDMESCNSTYDLELTDNMICAGENGKDSCQGDSGGPLVCSGQNLVGIVSFGRNCGLYPGVYTKLSAFHGWINKTISSSSDVARFSSFILSFFLILCTLQ